MISAGGKRELNSYELANVYNLYAFIHYSREDYGKALQAYENVVSQPDIPLAMEINTRFWGSLQLAVDAGVDFPWLLYRMVSGENPEGSIREVTQWPFCGWWPRRKTV